MRRAVPAALCALAAVCAAASADVDPDLLTVAERSGYKATARHHEVVELLDRIERRSPLARRISMGRTVEGRPIPVLVIADPALSTPEEARASGKLVLFAFGGIHAGEVCGKEALPMLARRWALDRDDPESRRLLDHAVILLAPIYNADANERVSKDNRPGQVGPEEGMGRRANAQGLDLNRDSMKLESPEARAMAGFLSAWDPHLIIDTHTTNGSIHQFTLTYEAPTNPSGHPAPIAFVRDRMLPEVSRRLQDRTGYKTFFYGNFNQARDAWYTYDHRPRFGGPYHGLRNRPSVLSEAYAYAPYEDRVIATREFVRECFLHAVEHADEVREIIRRADGETVEAGLTMRDHGLVGVRYEFAPFDEPVVIPTFVEREGERGRPVATDEPLDRIVTHYGRFTPTRSVVRPIGYLVPPELGHIALHMTRHGVVVERPERRPHSVEASTITSLTRAERPFQGHRTASVEVTTRADTLTPGEDWHFVSTAQPLGNLVVYMLEAESDDGVVTWNMLGDALREGAEYPILRVVRE